MLLLLLLLLLLLVRKVQRKGRVGVALLVLYEARHDVDRHRKHNCTGAEAQNTGDAFTFNIQAIKEE